MAAITLSAKVKCQRLTPPAHPVSGLLEAAGADRPTGTDVTRWQKVAGIPQACRRLLPSSPVRRYVRLPMAPTCEDDLAGVREPSGPPPPPKQRDRTIDQTGKRRRPITTTRGA